MVNNNFQFLIVFVNLFMYLDRAGIMIFEVKLIPLEKWNSEYSTTSWNHTNNHSFGKLYVVIIFFF